jgi:hypothetical protein
MITIISPWTYVEHISYTSYSRRYIKYGTFAAFVYHNLTTNAYICEDDPNLWHYAVYDYNIKLRGEGSVEVTYKPPALCWW